MVCHEIEMLSIQQPFYQNGNSFYWWNHLPYGAFYETLLIWNGRKLHSSKRLWSSQLQRSSHFTCFFVYDRRVDKWSSDGPRMKKWCCFMTNYYFDPDAVGWGGGMAFTYRKNAVIFLNINWLLWLSRNKSTEDSCLVIIKIKSKIMSSLQFIGQCSLGCTCHRSSPILS